MFAALRDENRRTDEDHDALTPVGVDGTDVRVVLARLEQASQVEAMIQTVASHHSGRRTYAVIASLPANEVASPDVVAAARRHAFMVVFPTGLCGAWPAARYGARDPGLLLEADLAHAITGTMQCLRRGDAMVVLCGCAATFALARRAVQLGRRWRASFDRPEGGDLSNVPSDPGMFIGNGAVT